MFLFRFIKFIKFRRNGMTPEWEERYDYLCENTDFLYLREREMKSSKKTLLGFLAYCVALWWLSLTSLFGSLSMILISVLFTVVLIFYSLSIYFYIPMEIEQTRIASKTELTRKPSSVVHKKIREHGVELMHKYFIYSTYSNKKGVDMTDRILGIDQNYELEEVVLCFTGINDDHYYILPKLSGDESHTTNEKENPHEDE